MKWCQEPRCTQGKRLLTFGISLQDLLLLWLMIHTVKGFGTVNKAEVDVFLELSCFFNDPVGISNLISGSSAFSNTSLNPVRY